MRNNWFVTFVLIFSVTPSQANEIIPQPKITLTKQFFTSWKPSQSIFSLDYSPILERHPITAKAILLSKMLPISFSPDTSSIMIRLKLNGQNLHFDKEMREIIPDSVWNKKEGYVLSVNQKEIFIYGFDQAGLLYGVQSLRQLVSHWIDGSPFRVQTLIDYPTLAFRGVMDDVSRGPLSNMDFLKKQMDRLGLLKINVFSFYIEHVLKTEKHYTYAPSDGITLTQLQELASYADSLNIKIMGSFQSLGHYKTILAHPEYEAMGASERMLKPADRASLQFLYEIYDELIPVSSHEIFNINCDEAYDLDRGDALNELAKEIGTGQVYFNHIFPLLQHVIGQGKTPALWGDVLLQYPEIIDQLPAGTVVFTWNYLAQENYDSYIRPFAGRKTPFIVTPGVVNSNRIWPDLTESAFNISHFIYEGWQAGALGALTTVWDDGGRHFFHCDWYGVALGAQHSWNPENRNTDQFSDDFYSVFYEGTGRLFAEFLRVIGEFQHTTHLKYLDNRLTELTYDINESNGFIDTTDFFKLIKLCDQSREKISKILEESKQNVSLFSSQDFRFWLFKIDELKESILSAQTMYQINQLKTNFQLSDERLSHQIDSIAKVRLRNNRHLAEEFKKLWYQENRDYYFEEMNEIYLDKIAIWKDISNVARANNLAAIPIYHASPDQFFTYWLSAGPFRLTPRDNIDTDFFKVIGGENKIKPAAIDYFPDMQGQYKSWKKIIGNKPDRLDLNVFYPESGLKVIYTQCQLYAEHDMVLTYELHFKGKHRAILNGQTLKYQGTILPGITDGELSLKKGRNDLMMKFLADSGTDNSFSFVLPGQKIESFKYRYYLHTTEQQ